jgi:hypothetical protein
MVLGLRAARNDHLEEVLAARQALPNALVLQSLRRMEQRMAIQVGRGSLQCPGPRRFSMKKRKLGCRCVPLQHSSGAQRVPPARLPLAVVHLDWHHAGVLGLEHPPTVGAAL